MDWLTNRTYTDMDWLINGTYGNFEDWYTRTVSLTDSQQTYHPKTRTYTLSTPTTVTKEDIDKMFDLDKIKEKEEEKVNMSVVNELSDTERMIVCKDINDLSPERILKTVVIMKDKLMSTIDPKKIQKIECDITPLVRTHMITAGKRLSMYGKRPPIIAHFDEFGQRLPDKVDFDTPCGVNLRIVDPKDFGEFYFSLKAILLPKRTYDIENFNPFYDCKSLDHIDLPFI